MRKAGLTLGEAETLSYKERTKSQSLNLKTSSIYPPGTEYAITAAEANLMHALIMLLSESFIESAKALYKLRRAYNILDEVHKQTIAYRKKKLNDVTSAFGGNPKAKSALELSTSSSSKVESSQSSITSKLSNINLTSNSVSGSVSKSNSTIDLPSATEKDILNKDVIEKSNLVKEMRQNRLAGTHINDIKTLMKHKSKSVDDLLKVPDNNDIDNQDAIAEQYSDEISTIDEFIESGSNLCFGALQVVLSLLPSGLGSVLSIIGLKGDREEGLKMLWKSALTRNIHGGLALLALLLFYDGPFQFSDINIQDAIDADGVQLKEKETKSANDDFPFDVMKPGHVLEETLLKASNLFPNCALWILEEARMLASKLKLHDSIKLMDSVTKPIQTAQIEALFIFDRNLWLLFTHQYDRAAEDFIKLIDINTWSHALYMFFAGSCHVDQYRKFLKEGNLTEAENYKKLANDCLVNAPDLIGKKKWGSKMMPFDVFLSRKINYWKKVAETEKIDFVDAIGTSPIHELMYFYNGFSRLDEENSKTAFDLLQYSATSDDADADADADIKESEVKEIGEADDDIKDTENETTSKPKYPLIKETEEEGFIRYVLQSLALRSLNRTEEGMELLNKQVISKIVTFENGYKKDGKTLRYHFNKQYNLNPWVYPVSLYEYAVFNWKVNGVKGIEDTKEWLRKSLAWSDDYELSTRISLKVKAALDHLNSVDLKDLN